MRRGRAADREDDWGDAFASLSAAAGVFRDAAAQDPGSPRSLGNWGNALLQLGRVHVPAIAVPVSRNSVQRSHCHLVWPEV